MIFVLHLKIRLLIIALKYVGVAQHASETLNLPFAWVLSRSSHAAWQEWEFAKIERIPGYGSLQAS